jgi:hypothetical protein
MCRLTHIFCYLWLWCQIVRDKANQYKIILFNKPTLCHRGESWYTDITIGIVKPT